MSQRVLSPECRAGSLKNPACCKPVGKSAQQILMQFLRVNSVYSFFNESMINSISEYVIPDTSAFSSQYIFIIISSET